MKYSYFFILFIVGTITSSSFAQSVPLEQKKRINSMFFYYGFDLESTPTHRRKAQYDIFNTNLGLGYNWAMRRGWALQLEMAFQQFATPPVRLAHTFHVNTNTDRILLTDTVSVNRLTGVSGSVLVARKIGWGITLRCGMYASKYTKALVEISAKKVQPCLDCISGNGLVSSRQSNNKYGSVPDWVAQEQFGLQFGIEKIIFNPFYMGFSTYKGLRDMTPLHKTVKNYPTNMILYVGIRANVR